MNTIESLEQDITLVRESIANINKELKSKRNELGKLNSKLSDLEKAKFLILGEKKPKKIKKKEIKDGKIQY